LASARRDGTCRESDLWVSKKAGLKTKGILVPMYGLWSSEHADEGLNWTLICVMISSAPGEPWIWALLVSAGAALSLWRRR
jgi:hypothetical protein